MSNGWASSPIEASPSPRRSRTALLVGSARAPNTRSRLDDKLSIWLTIYAPRGAVNYSYPSGLLIVRREVPPVTAQVSEWPNARSFGTLSPIICSVTVASLPRGTVGRRERSPVTNERGRRSPSAQQVNRSGCGMPWIFRGRNCASVARIRVRKRKRSYQFHQRWRANSYTRLRNGAVRVSRDRLLQHDRRHSEPPMQG